MSSFQSLCRNAGLTLAGSLALAVASTISQTEKAGAVDLSFGTPVETNNVANPGGLNLGAGFNGASMRYLNVASGVDARVTATVTGANYSFSAHTPNYSSNLAQPNGDIAPIYEIAANQIGAGAMTYKIDLFNSGSNFTTAFTAPELRFLIYDVDGEASQGEAVRIARGGGFVGYQVGNTAQALAVTSDATSFLFSGRNVNIPETNTDGAAIFYFQNTNSATFRFEANTRTSTNNINPVFSAIDGDLSLIGSNFSSFSGFVSTANATAVPEPFTVIGSILGGTAAFRMRKKLKASNKA